MTSPGLLHPSVPVNHSRHLNISRPWLACLLILTGPLSQGDIVADDGVLQAHFSRPTGHIRALHGINKGPLVPGGLINLVSEHRELRLPFVRLHDCGWPNPYVVDHHVVFPNPGADPMLPESYDFRLTDEYIAAVRQTGAEPVYRLGESIEHTTVKRYVHPPSEPGKWSQVCLGIIRHYNEGWADGFHHDIRYWEIWNEPENRPAMWSGTDEDYLQLYRTAATAIKAEFPDLKVGGPALGASGSFVDGQFQPTEFAARFLNMCSRENVPLNFFSWHCYTADPAELSKRCVAIRKLINDAGLPAVESHLNEWNYLPGNTWEPLSAKGTALKRQEYFAEMSGSAGAAFVATSLLELQDAPVDLCNLFHGEAGAFGVFSEQGVPTKVYDALHAFRQLADTASRVETTGSRSGRMSFAAGLSTDERSAMMLISNFSDDRSEYELRWDGFHSTKRITAEIRLIGEENNYSSAHTATVVSQDPSLRLALKSPGVALIRLQLSESE